MKFMTSWPSISGDDHHWFIPCGELCRQILLVTGQNSLASSPCGFKMASFPPNQYVHLLLGHSSALWPWWRQGCRCVSCMPVLQSLTMHSLSCGWPRGISNLPCPALNSYYLISLPCPLYCLSPYTVTEASSLDLHSLPSLAKHVSWSDDPVCSNNPPPFLYPQPPYWSPLQAVYTSSIPAFLKLKWELQLPKKLISAHPKIPIQSTWSEACKVNNFIRSIVLMLWIQGVPFERHAVAPFWSLSFCPGSVVCPHRHHNNHLAASPTMLCLYLPRKAQVSHPSGDLQPAYNIARGSEYSSCEQVVHQTVWLSQRFTGVVA